MCTAKHVKKCFCIPLKDCPDGYRPRPGDIPGQARFGCEVAISNCASKCNEKESCLSFEHSKAKDECTADE